MDEDSYHLQPIANIPAICAYRGVQHVVISPGSRSAPLTVAFARQPNLCCRVVIDERAAAFVALGLAQQTRRPVGLICTSGTAALNYAPAVAEAFYQEIPLLIFNADRPPEWIDQQDGQTIRQQQIYGRHVRASFELPADYAHPDARWHLERIISEAINAAVWPVPGPVQINVPLREPLYPTSDNYRSQPDSKVIHLSPVQPTLPEEHWAELESVWAQAGRKLIVGGLQPFDPALSTALAILQQDHAVAVVGDLTGNLHQSGTQLHHWDMILSTRSADIKANLAPELLITFGGPVVSKALKLFLRRHRPQAHWHIDPAARAIDTFQCLSRIIPTDGRYFFENLAHRSALPTTTSAAYLDLWLNREAAAQAKLDAFFETASFGEFSAIRQVLLALPEPSRLQLGNSMPVRYAEYLGLAGRAIQVNANRGTSGIDGTLSTTVGAALATDQITTLICGDLAFFYDRNGLWHNDLPKNLRIVVLNNHGGGIFHLIDGPTQLPAEELTRFFETPQPLTARRTAADHGCAYFHCAAVAELQAQLPAFFSPETGPAILEIETDGSLNTQVFQQFKAIMA